MEARSQLRHRPAEESYVTRISHEICTRTRVLFEASEKYFQFSLRVLLTAPRNGRTIERLSSSARSAWLPRDFSAMNDLEIAVPRQDVTLGRGSAEGNQLAGVNPAALDNLIHELRQPLSAIDSLAYFLEITSSDETVRAHLQRIQAMVSHAHYILDRSCNMQIAQPAA